MEIRYFCGIDVSKNSFSVAVKNGQFLIKNKSFSMDKEGFRRFEELIFSYKDSLIAGMEATGIYHQNLFNFLQNRGYNSCVVNPYRVSNFFKFRSNKPTKTDKKDSKTISEFLEEEVKNNPSFMQEKQDERFNLRYLVREKERITQSIAKTKTEIKRIVSLVFPELEAKTSIFSKEILDILYEFSSADRIRKLTFKEFINRAQVYIPNGKGRKVSIKKEEIYKLAKDSISFSYPAYEKLLKIKIKRLRNLMEEKKEIEEIIKKEADKFFRREIEILTSIPGIAKESAIYFMAEIVDIRRFKNKRKLIGFCGLDPVIKQSGNYKGRFKISKRGNSHTRRIAFIMAGCVKKRCPYFREYYLKKRREGKSYKEAVIATSTKLLRTIYTLLKEDRLFK